MPRRASHLQLRGNVYWLRLRVPDVLRPVIGKTEIRKSLGTSDYREAQLLARIERVKIDADWERHRNRLSPVHRTDLSDREVWQLAAQWLVNVEDRNSKSEDRWESLEEAKQELDALSTPHNLAVTSFRQTEKLLAGEGIKLDPGSESWVLLDGFIRKGLIEAARRDIQRSFPQVPLTTDPQFASLTGTTILHPVAN